VPKNVEVLFGQLEGLANPVEGSRLGVAEVKAMSKLDELIAKRTER